MAVRSRPAMLAVTDRRSAWPARPPQGEFLVIGTWRTGPLPAATSIHVPHCPQDDVEPPRAPRRSLDRARSRTDARSAVAAQLAQRAGGGTAAGAGSQGAGRGAGRRAAVRRAQAE